MRDKTLRERIEDTLSQTGPQSIKFVASLNGLSVEAVRSVVEQNAGMFDMIGVAGPPSTWCISISDPARPIQLVLENDDGKTRR